MRTKTQSGFTLIELMVTLAVIGVVASVANASFGSMFKSRQLVTYSNDLVNTLNRARSEAITRKTRVTVCQKAAGAARTCDNSTDWNNGWMIFVDTGNIVAGLSQPANNDAVLHIHESVKSSFNLAGNLNIANNISFTAVGFPRRPIGGGLQMGTFLICGPQGYDKQSRKIVITTSGRIQTRSPSDGKTRYNKSGPVTCPSTTS